MSTNFVIIGILEQDLDQWQNILGKKTEYGKKDSWGIWFYEKVITPFLSCRRGEVVVLGSVMSLLLWCGTVFLITVPTEQDFDHGKENGGNFSLSVDVKRKWRKTVKNSHFLLMWKENRGKSVKILHFVDVKGQWMITEGGGVLFLLFTFYYHISFLYLNYYTIEHGVYGS